MCIFTTGCVLRKECVIVCILYDDLYLRDGMCVYFYDGLRLILCIYMTVCASVIEFVMVCNFKTVVILGIVS